MNQPVANQQSIEFINILTGLSDENSERRSQAEATYNTIPVQDKFSCLGAILFERQIPEPVRLLAAVLLRRLCSSSWTEIQAAIPADQLRASCNQLLGLVKILDESKEIREKICHVISGVAHSYLVDPEDVNQWTEFVEFLLELFRSQQLELRIAGFMILSDNPDVFGLSKGKPAYLPQLAQLFHENLIEKDKPPQFWSELVSAVSRYLVSISNHRKSCKELENLSIYLAAALRDVTDETHKEKIAQDLIEVAEEMPLILRPAIETIMQTCLAMMSSDDEAIRFSGLELDVALVENAPIMIKKRANAYIKPLVLRILAFMTEMEDDDTWHETNTNDRDEESADVIAESALDRVSNALGGKVLLPILMDELTAMLQKPEWQARHAALMAFSSAGEGCREQLRRVLDRVVGGIIAYLSDPHPRVRHAACNAIGQMSTDFAPDIENKFHAQIVPSLCKLIVDTSSKRVQAHAACAMINFFEECQQDMIANYLDLITEHIQSALNLYMVQGIPNNECDVFVLENIIVALSSVADSSGELFSKYYERFTPGLKYIIQNSSGKDELRLLRGKAIECVSLIGMAVGKELFYKDATDIMQILLASQTGELKIDYDDPQLSYMMAAWARICRILGSDFKTYLPFVMGPVLEAASLKVEIALLNEEDKAAISDSNEWESVSLQDQSVGIRTAGLEDKATACSMLVCYARELKQGFVDYVEPTAEVLVPLLKFPFHDDVKCAAAEAMPYLLESAKPRGEQFVISLWNAMFEGLMGALTMDSEPPVLNELLESLGNSIEIIGTSALSEERHEQITMKLIERFNAHFNELAEEIERRKDEDYESESDCSDDDRDCLTGICSLLHSLLKVYGPAYLGYFEQIANWVTRLAMDNQYVNWTNRHSALCIWADVIEYTGAQGCQQFQQYFLPLLQAHILDKKPGNRQAAVYSIGKLADQCGNAYAEFFQQCLPNLVQMINDPESRSEDCVMATENAISAISRILQHCLQLQNRQQLLECWLQWLPITEDDEEIPNVVKFLVSLIEQNDPIVMDQNGANKQRMVDLVNKMQSILTVRQQKANK